MKLEKITKPKARRYDDACATAHALDLVGERWALLVMRELMFGPRRFVDLRTGLPGISANVLTQRLEGLEAVGILQKKRLPPPAATQVYELTEWGYESEPVFQALGRFAARSPHHDPSLPFSAASFLLSLRTMLDGEKSAGLDWRINLKLGEEDYAAKLADGAIAISRGTFDDPTFSLEGEPRMLAAVIYGGVPLEALEGEGAIIVAGDRHAAKRFTTLFPLPEKASPPPAP